MRERPDSEVGDGKVTITCLCRNVYESTGLRRLKCPRCGRVWDLLGALPVTGQALDRLKVIVKDAWARRERQYPPIPDVKTPWPCGVIPYPPDPECC